MKKKEEEEEIIERIIYLYKQNVYLEIKKKNIK